MTRMCSGMQLVQDAFLIRRTNLERLAVAAERGWVVVEAAAVADGAARVGRG
jgi:hypothetical protein